MHNTRKTHFEECPALFLDEKRLVNRQNARESLAWDNLREVHKLSQEEFLVRTRNQTDEWLDKVYGRVIHERKLVICRCFFSLRFSHKTLFLLALVCHPSLFIMDLTQVKIV